MTDQRYARNAQIVAVRFKVNQLSR